MVLKKERHIAYIFWFACFFGLCGIHRFYLGKYVSGTIYLFTFGLLGFGQILDLFLIPNMVNEKNLIIKALSEDAKNDAIRQATLVMSSLNTYEKNVSPKRDMIKSQDSYEQTILDILASGKKYSLGRIISISNLSSDIVIKEIQTLINKNIISQYKKPNSDKKFYFIERE
tara:strand:- start:323 stop:835 length:513 start_codon:yes stop_codon:yes gene_type:complete